MNKSLLTLLPVLLVLLSGCAASLVYDQDRTPRDCHDDPQRRCVHGAIDAVTIDALAMRDAGAR